MDSQLKRNQYPDEFPLLPNVPTARYYDAEFAAAEIRHMWKKTWLLVGVESELKDPGSYLLFEELDLSVIVRRGKDGSIGGFHNICPHRGAALVTEPRGHLARFVCPYHAWSFDLRSEEHTSELQSLMRISYAVFCLKKKTSYTPTNKSTK